MLVHFFELSGPQAKHKLLLFSKEIPFLRVSSIELLESLEQSGLFLLVIKSETKINLNPPQGTRAWVFASMITL